MCGIVGFISSTDVKESYSISSMTDALFHRGPDDEGHFTQAINNSFIALGHRRLSILDLSASGHQPMYSKSGRFVIVLNGEIYNHLQLRQQLNFISWEGHSDTETLLAAIESWGVGFALEKCIGMFAFALYDKDKNELILSRDRIGEKPLYYGFNNGVFYFTSELKALRSSSDNSFEIDKNALSLYFKYGYIPAPHSIYKNIFKLKPGTFLTLSVDNYFDVDYKLKTYWSYENEVNKNIDNKKFYSDDDSLEEFQRLLTDSIRMQKLSDVPLGAFLSGGIDSTLVTAILQDVSRNPVKTFTIGFNEKKFDEAPFAKAIASHLRTDHTEYYLSSKDSLDIVPNIANIFDEPFGDASSVPTYLVSKIAKENVTVALSGDGGDELFGGYSRYQRDTLLWNNVSRFNKSFRKISGNFLQTISLQRKFSNIDWVVKEGNFLRRSNNLGQLLNETEFETFYTNRRTIWADNDSLLINPIIGIDKNLFNSRMSNATEKMMYHDMLMYLPDDLLVKVDRSAMAVSLETRAPLLDHRIVSFAASIPLNQKIRNNSGKWIMRNLLYKYVPKNLVERPKMGFMMPIDNWLRNELKFWMLDLLNPESVKKQGLFNIDVINKTVHNHFKGIENNGYKLWPLLMFQSWYYFNKKN